MRIGELAERTNVTTKTIRYYESIGLMPAPARTPSGYRDYAGDAVERLQFIREAQASGLRLADVQSVLELKDSGERSCAHTRALLRRHLQELDEQIHRLTEARSNLLDLANRAERLDPAECTDPIRCQVIDTVDQGSSGDRPPPNQRSS